MRKALLIPIIALILVSVFGLVMFYSEGGFGGGGRGYGAQMALSAQASHFVGLLIFVVPLAIAMVAVVYWVAFPEIKTLKPKEDAEKAEKGQALNAVLRVLNADEKKVVETLASSKENAMLQKDIRWKTGMSRVKTHRVLARLAARGIIRAEKHYNTNKISLTEWIAGNTKNNDTQ